MEKCFAIGIPGVFAMLAAGVLGVPVAFAPEDIEALGVWGHAKQFCLALVLAYIGYKIIMKLIETFGTLLLARLNTHDTEVQGRLSDIVKKVDKIEGHISTIVLANTDEKGETS
jgi:hypothetical protein